MAKTLSAKHRKRRMDRAMAYKADPSPQKHKVAIERSRKALKKKAWVMA